MRSGGPMPPPPPPGPPSGPGPHPSGNMTIRRPIQTTFKLPTVHWTAMKPNDTKDTIWYLMDDSKVIKDLDLGWIWIKLSSLTDLCDISSEESIYSKQSFVLQL